MDFIFGFSRKLCFCYELKFKRKTKHCVFCTGTINSEKTKPAKLRICLVQAQPFCPINQLGISLNLFTDNDKVNFLFLCLNFVNSSSNEHLPWSKLNVVLMGLESYSDAEVGSIMVYRCSIVKYQTTLSGIRLPYSSAMTISNI